MWWYTERSMKLALPGLPPRLLDLDIQRGPGRSVRSSLTPVDRTRVLCAGQGAEGAGEEEDEGGEGQVPRTVRGVPRGQRYVQMPPACLTSCTRPF